jgi:hypothetical protein
MTHDCAHHPAFAVGRLLVSETGLWLHVSRAVSVARFLDSCYCLAGKRRRIQECAARRQKQTLGLGNIRLPEGTGLQAQGQKQPEENWRKEEVTMSTAELWMTPDNDENSYWHTIYTYPLGRTYVNSKDYEVNETGLELFCLTGAPPETIHFFNGGRWHT